MKSEAFIIKTDNNSYVGMNNVIVTKLHLAILYSDEMFVESELKKITEEYINTDYKFEIKTVEINIID